MLLSVTASSKAGGIISFSIEQESYIFLIGQGEKIRGDHFLEHSTDSATAVQLVGMCIGRDCILNLTIRRASTEIMTHRCYHPLHT